MATLGLNHVNIRTLDVATTVRFYTHVLGFRYDGPKQVGGFARNWLYDQASRPVIHLREMAPEAASTGPIDHIALTCDDMPTILERLKAEHVRFAARDNPTDGIVQVFVKDPNGVTLELNFPLAERATS